MLMGVWPDSTIFVPGCGDLPIPVGSAIIFSGSKAHAGSGYQIGNRRLHFYFFSSRTWASGVYPLEDKAAFLETRRQLLEESMDTTQRLQLESNLMNNLQVYDFDDDEHDAFEKSSDV
jgi:hypothetical protein